MKEIWRNTCSVCKEYVLPGECCACGCLDRTEEREDEDEDNDMD